MAKEGNRLLHERSLYLQQHAHNPVDWYPWGAEALSRARREERPLFLSVGYASCHWCHVMEREVFEREDVAALLNERFVSIKVDREERPDLDAAYMEALQAMTGSGGWPMSLFLTPDGKPIYGGTYLPPELFLEVARRIHRAWTDERSTLEQQAGLLARGLSSALKLTPEELIEEEAIGTAARRALSLHDERWGGLGGPMKFPTPPRWSFLLHRYRRTGDERLARAVRTTLEAMSTGGIRDHVGGGFHRYAVEPTWVVPHFEKMLYDNAQLASLYLEAATVLDAPRYAEVAADTLDFILRDLRGADGGFYASLDADSGGVEGACYVWTQDELLTLVGPVDGPPLAELLGVTAQGNFEHRNVLTRRQGAAEVASRHGRSPAEVAALFDRWRPALLERRASRPAPALDRKVITSWNGLTVSALARAARVLGRQDFRRAAEEAVRYLWRVHRREDGRLYRASTDGHPASEAVLSDYACLAAGLLELFQATQDQVHLRHALDLAGQALSRFAAPGGGFFMTAAETEAPLGRQLDLTDSVRPSGTSVMLHVLIRAAALTGDQEYLGPVEKSLRHFGSLLHRTPLEMLGWYDAAQEYQGPFYEVVIAGSERSADTRALVEVIERLQPSHAVLLRVPAGGPPPEVAELLPPTRGKTALADFATAYVCRFGSCASPTTDPGVLERQLLEGWTL